MRQVTKLAAVVVAGALALAGCGSASGGAATGGGNTFKVGLAYDIGGRGDQSFNDAAARGLDQAISELGGESKDIEAVAGETDQQKEERLELLVAGGYDPIIAVGFAYAGPLKTVAAKHPDVNFAIVDDASFEAPNVANLVFAEEEGSFLVGAAAALKTRTKNVGFVGGVSTPLIQKFEAGYKAGVKAVDPSIRVQTTYLTQPPDYSGFNDPAKAKVAADGMFDKGADIVYHAAGGSGKGVFDSAKAKGGLGIGVDSDQYNQASLAEVKESILTSMVKDVDVAVFDFIKSVAEGKPLTGKQVYDLKREGVGYATSGGRVDDIKARLDEFAQKISAGEIVVPQKP